MFVAVGLAWFNGAATFFFITQELYQRPHRLVFRPCTAHTAQQPPYQVAHTTLVGLAIFSNQTTEKYAS